MTVTIKCQHSGIEFEAASKRTKNHPIVSKMKVQAAKDGLYEKMTEALQAVKNAGGYSTIDEYVSMVEKIVAGEEEARAQEAKEIAALKVAAADEQKERKHRNSVLRASGYRWEKFPEFEGDFEMGISSGWVLLAPDGLSISVSDAWEIVQGKMSLEDCRKNS